MDEPAAWRELATRFFELHNGGLQQMFAVWQPMGHNSADDTWSLGGLASRDARERFEWTAERGAVLLGHGGGLGSLAYWLDALRKGSPRFTPQRTGHALEDGFIEMEEGGAISNVCFASAEYCYKLETAAIAHQAELGHGTRLKSAIEKRQFSRHRKNREQRLQSFLRKHETTIAAVRSAARVAKANMQQWRREELADSSVMSERIERVLSGEIPLPPKG